jgi:lysophospholipase L1-like esterase
MKKTIYLSMMFLPFLLAHSASGQEQWKYTALGDSLATGYTSPTGGYVTRYKAHVTADTGAAVMLSNYGFNGRSSSGLLNALRTDLAMQMSVNQSNVITWDIGLNDFMNARNSYKNKKCGGSDSQECLRSMVASFKTNWNGIISEITFRASPMTAVIRTMDIYNPWVKADMAKNTIQDTKEAAPTKGTDFQVLKYYLDQMNAHIAVSANSNNIPTAGIYSAFNGASGSEDPIAKGLMNTDGIHPSEVGFQMISDNLRALGYLPLR